jgi:hypothetical protein
MTFQPINAQNFWDTDLEEIESAFLGARKVTDLPTTLDRRVPHQGSVLLDSTVNIDTIVLKPSLAKRLLFRLRNPK